MNLPRTRGTSVVVYDVERRVQWWAIVARAWHRGDRCTRVVLRGGSAPWRVVADERRDVTECGGTRTVNARFLRVTR